MLDLNRRVWFKMVVKFPSSSIRSSMLPKSCLSVKRKQICGEIWNLESRVVINEWFSIFIRCSSLTQMTSIERNGAWHSQTSMKLYNKLNSGSPPSGIPPRELKCQCTNITFTTVNLIDECVTFSGQNYCKLLFSLFHYSFHPVIPVLNHS